MPLITMNRLTIDQIVALVSVAMILCVGIVRIPDVMDRARVPFIVTEIDGVVIVTAISDEKGAANLRTGDRIIRMDGVDVTISETLEHLADVRRVGDLVAVEYDRGGMRYEEG
ncbi:MAG: PDZ domain-containing protein, partial [Bacteroidetes bacterium]|nr:PDZ domain-containing protein [Bacteroidota bacterium]